MPDEQKKDANLAFEQKAQELAAATQRSIEEAREALKAQQKIQRYRVDYVDDENGPFYLPVWEGVSVVVGVNKKHPFFQSVYGTLLQSEGGLLAKEAVDLLLITLAREELRTKNSETREFYRAQRVERWSPFLASGLRTLTRDFPTPEAEDEIAA